MQHMTLARQYQKRDGQEIDEGDGNAKPADAVYPFFQLEQIPVPISFFYKVLNPFKKGSGREPEVYGQFDAGGYAGGDCCIFLHGLFLYIKNFNGSASCPRMVQGKKRWSGKGRRRPGESLLLPGHMNIVRSYYCQGKNEIHEPFAEKHLSGAFKKGRRPRL
jgi:hypothetical protein